MKFKRSGSYWRQLARNKKVFENASTRQTFRASWTASQLHRSNDSSPNSTPPSTRPSSPDLSETNSPRAIDSELEDNISECSEIYYSPEEDNAEVDINEEDGELFDPIQKDIDFKLFLRLWAVDFNIRQDALKPLIARLNQEFGAKIPRDPRTLLETGTGAKGVVTEMCKGEYIVQTYL